MRTILIKRVKEDGLYSRAEAARELGVSERTFDRYFRDDKFDESAVKVGTRLIYTGDQINSRILELLGTDKFVERTAMRS